jgi:hypothetical protein
VRDCRSSASSRVFFTGAEGRRVLFRSSVEKADAGGSPDLTPFEHRGRI